MIQSFEVDHPDMQIRYSKRKWNITNEKLIQLDNKRDEAFKYIKDLKG